MDRKVAIVSAAQTKYERKNREQSHAELVHNVVKEAIDKIGLDLEEVDTVVQAGCDIIDGRSISNVYTTEAAGAFMKDETKVEEDGIFAALYGFMRILGGAFNIAVVVAYGKTSEGSMNLTSHLITDPFYQRPLGLDGLTSCALQARQYMAKYNVTEEDAALVAVKNHKNAKLNFYAQTSGDFTVADVLKSSYLASPIKELDACPISDGACAIVLASNEKADKLTKTPVWIKGVAHILDAFYPGHRDLANLTSCKKAAQRAYKMAGINNPLKEIDVAEISEYFSFQELMLYEALGFCETGYGKDLIRKKVTEINGDLPVNPSGGVLSANPVVATGLIRVAEAYLQLSGNAGEHQVKDAKTALAHGTSGLAFQSNGVIILGVE